MSTISTKFRIYKNAAKDQQILKVCAKCKGSKQYFPRVITSFNVGSLVNPDMKKWDKSKQRFRTTDPNSRRNNAVLEAVEAICDEIIKTHNPESPAKFWELVDRRDGAVKKHRPNSKLFTFGEFLERIIKELYEGKNNKLPSSNYQVYVRLLHHLEREDVRRGSKHIIQTPLVKISDKEFFQFGAYIRTLPKVNYMDNMRYFKRAHNLAIKKKMVTVPLTYRYMDDQPAKSFDELMMASKGIASLSAEQIEAVENLDLSKLELRCKNHEFYKQLYRDTCLLMFHLYSRPIDILNMTYKNIRVCDKGMYIEYLPIKKKNNPKAQKDFVKCPINAKAMAIIKKYKDMSPAGYLLPFSENKKTWNLSDPAEYHTRFNRCNCMLGKINAFLKKIAEALDITFFNDTLTTYVFRHSAISIAIMNKKIPPMVVAKMAGTSIKEIERSYMDHTTNMFEYV